MAIKTSTGLRVSMLVTESAKDSLDGGFLKFYSGTEPATADAAVAGSLLWTVSVDGDGTGLTFEATTTDGVMVKTTTETWQGATTAGTPNYWRFVEAADTGVLSTSEKRIQGTCGNTAGVDIFLTNPVLTTNASLDAKVLDAFSISLLTN